jgi:hypothetical protein
MTLAANSRRVQQCFRVKNWTPKQIVGIFAGMSKTYLQEIGSISEFFG